MTALAFWTALACVAYAYAGYPLLLLLSGRILDRTVRKRPITPRLSLIIAAYNEEEEIGPRLDNALALDYPPDALEILVASDGSTDATEAIVAGYAPRGVRLLPLARRGKLPALHDAVQRARGEILVFSDANTHLHPRALRALASNFADPRVGGVAGHTRYLPAEAGESSSRGERLYWRYDTLLKEMESRTGSVVSAHGGLYAIRRSLYRPSPEAAVTDDFVLSTAVVEQGFRLVFEREALAYERVVSEASREFGRKVRLMTRAWRSVALRRRLLNPARYGIYSLVFFSHKVLRRSLPLVLPVLFGCSLALAETGPFHLAAATGQCLLYGLGALGWAARRTPLGHRKALYVPSYFCMANAAALLALFHFARGRRIHLWQPQRHAPVRPSRETSHAAGR